MTEGGIGVPSKHDVTGDRFLPDKNEDPAGAVSIYESDVLTATKLLFSHFSHEEGTHP